ncbi:NADH dehydrogenase ubiquinone Fe-S protein 4 [Sphingomonas paucimobilis]|uniref:NADH dehydrogenase ubiquinone Fe-S protein 4 n=2 Tax=Sphingomonas paucimobilis TaxID=13689 RepID=UPI0039E985F3
MAPSLQECLMRSRFARYRAQLPARLRARLNRQLGQRRSPAEPSHDANASHDRNSPVDRWWLRYLSSLPEDARAVIEPLPTATNQGGRARKNQWRLRFQQRKKPFVDWLMGWTGGEDPLVHIDLRFPSREAAIRYCERLDLPYEVHEPPPATITPVNKQRFELDDAPVLEWPGQQKE